MRITKDSKLGVALAVLRKVEIRPSQVSVKMYSDCREQGFMVISYHTNTPDEDIGNRRVAVFSENKSSDDIVVQYGYERDFDEHGVFKDEEKWNKQRKYFYPEHHEKAADFVSKWLKYFI